VSGFFGMLRLDGQPIDTRLLERIAAEISFRGPDGTSVSNEGRVGGCFALMRTGPAPQASQQPVRCGNRLWLWVDIRLDSRRELLRDLGAEESSPGQNATSEELLLSAWTKWGAGSLERINGDFSFGLWDAKEETLWCARDFVGARPFYYACVRGIFCFSNTLPILRLVPEVSGELDELFIADYLLEGWSSEPCRTVYRDIRRLPAGHCLQLKNDTPEIRRFRKLPVEEPLRLNRPEEYVERYLDLLNVAVSDRLPEGATSLYLSGGLDSSSVCAIASQIAAARGRKEKLKAFTLSGKPVFEDPEPTFAQLTARHLGIAQKVLDAADLRPYERAGTWEGRTPEPDDEIFFARIQNDFREIAAYSNVILSGDGGDNVLTGQSWPYLTYLWKNGEQKRIAREFGAYLWSHGAFPPLRGGFRAKLLQFFRSDDPFAAYPEWLNPDFEAKANLKQRWVASRDSDKNAEHPVHPLAYKSLHSGYWASVLETEDAGWNRVRLESRAPLLDLRLLAFLLRLPAVPWCVNKFLSRQTMTGLLPQEIVSRPKTPLLVQSLVQSLQPADWTTSLLNAVPGRVQTFVNWPKWCETLYRSKGSLTLDLLRPASLSYWLKAVESD
jgi:asparagine synthase (glutamine-hydrolysing)